MNGVSKTLLGMTVLAVPALGLAQQSGPQPFSYSYVELGYDESDFDFGGGGGGGEIDGDGLTLSGSWAINDDWHVYGAYQTADLDFGLDYDALAIGAGYRYPLRDDVDLYGRVMYIDGELDAPGPGELSEDGLALQVRIRYRVSNEFEVEGGIQHADVFDSDTSLQASARYHFTRNFSAGLGLTFAGDTDSFGINARYSF